MEGMAGEPGVHHCVGASWCCGLYNAASLTTPDLSIYSSFKPHQDTAKAEGMFATVVVVLPSKFEGGQIRLSHA
ncbi:hypothetical protein CC2G_003754 [Coprinopsis cinerea AmutBmut pab1-1]|nr:hypothetical protein CC2G_003754 [Coprinopsis cinerea AmutBmut pab1-1]